MTEGDAGKPRKPRRALAMADRRLQLIEATITSIAKYGLTGTTLARVTKIAGTSFGLASFHFETKERLLEAVLMHLAEEHRVFWQKRNLDASLSPVDRLMAIIDSRFHSQICDRKKLAIWFAFWGDARTRNIYRKVLTDVDKERVAATLVPLKLMIDEGDYLGIDPAETALALETMFDGLWLNMLLYPDEFNRQNSRARALRYVAAVLPKHYSTTGAPGFAKP